MSFHVPDYDSIDREGKGAPDEGRYDVTVTAIDTGRSGTSGDPQMIWTMTIDNGPNAGYEIRNWFTFKPGSDIAWSQLANICDAVGFRFEDASSVEKFAAQFPLNELRFSVDLGHQHSIKAFTDTEKAWEHDEYSAERTEATPHENWVTVQPSEYEEWEGEKNIRAQIRDGFDFQNIFAEAEGERELQFTEDGPVREPVAAGDGAAAEGFEPDDELPF